MSIKKYFYKIKKRLVKKVILIDTYKKNEFLYFELELKNFFFNIKDISILFKVQENELQLSYEYEKSRLLVKLPISLISYNDYNKFDIILYINGKKMWIKDSGVDNKNIIVSDDLLSINANKKIRLSKRFTDLKFNNSPVQVQIIETKYDNITCTIDSIEGSDKLYAIKNGHIKEISMYFQDNTVVLKEFLLFSMGLWQVFVSVNNTLHPLKVTFSNGKEFNTMHHNVKIEERGSLLFLNFTPHIFITEKVEIKKETSDFFSLIIENPILDQNKKYYLIINDVLTNDELIKEFKDVEKNLTLLIHLDELLETYSRKRFYILEESDCPIKYQFNLDDIHFDSKLEFQEPINSEVMLINFYKRKDKSLGFRVKRPKLSKMIMNIEDFKVEGYLKTTNNKFIDCTAHLMLEDRNTKESSMVMIGNEFCVDLLKMDLIKLKGKEKTIIDLFIVILNEKGSIIRKEKIKYKYANYRKDNYYGYKLLKDSNLNQHHFLITTTPFNNLKIESFMIPNNIEIPSDTSIKDDNIWLIGERYNTAQDNGIVLFNWLQKNTDIDAYYVIEEDSQDYDKIKTNPNVLTFGSAKHYEIAFKAKVLLGTHDLENILPYKPAKGFFDYEKTYRVFLQHGVLGRKNVEYHKKYYDIPFNLFIVSSEPEKYDIVIDKFGYEESDVVVTGLARFDKLYKNKETRDILLMPTWRDWINTEEAFFSSDYYTRYSNLINNKRLIEILETHDVTLNFYPHYRAQEYFIKSQKEMHDRIKFIPFGEKTVQQLLIDHALLITDYSSVSFDFLLMDKPVIYYHFDERRFFRKGILRPIEETFIGKIAKTENEIIDLIEDRLVKNFENYNLDLTGILKYQDQSNCERIFEAIQNGLKKGS